MRRHASIVGLHRAGARRDGSRGLQLGAARRSSGEGYNRRQGPKRCPAGRRLGKRGLRRWQGLNEVVWLGTWAGRSQLHTRTGCRAGCLHGVRCAHSSTPSTWLKL